MRTLVEIVAEFELPQEELLLWIQRRWVLPLAQEDNYVFADADIARVRMILDLRRDLAIDDDAMSVVLDLLDKLYGLRREMREILSAIDELPEPQRDKLLSRIAHASPDDSKA